MVITIFSDLFHFTIIYIYISNYMIFYVAYHISRWDWREGNLTGRFPMNFIGKIPLGS